MSAQLATAERETDQHVSALVDSLIGELADRQAKRRIIAAFEKGRLSQEEALSLIGDCGFEDVEI